MQRNVEWKLADLEVINKEIQINKHLLNRLTPKVKLCVCMTVCYVCVARIID